MSSETWLEEFYPVTAAECAEDAKGDALVLVEHSLRKWRGATKTALRKHKIEKPPIIFNADTCALCEAFLSEDRDGRTCGACPLCLSRRGTPCDNLKPPEFKSPFESYRYARDPRPMIRALEKAREYVQISQRPATPGQGETEER